MYAFSEEQSMVRDSARSIARAESVSGARTLLAPESKIACSSDLSSKLHELGFPGMLVDEDHGGSDMDMVAACLVARELGRELVISPLLGTTVTAHTIARFGSDKMREDCLAGITEGTEQIGLGLDGEVVLADGLLNGVCAWGIDAVGATSLIIRADHDDVSVLALVPVDNAGIEIAPRRMADGRMLAQITLNAVQVERDTIMSDEAPAAAMNCAATWISAYSCGTVEAAFELTLDYLRERKQFDRRIASFQAIQHRLAQIYCEIEDGWSATHRAAIALDRHEAELALHSSVAKAKLADLSRVVLADCLQLHGGIGMTAEHDIGLFLKSGRVSSELLGGYSHHADIVARELGF
ncbi:acyl-CoA dehydrogenase family protein [Paracoccus sp. SCSIO 75233]|uniref:acyl-CoA dehydrogenase family protein n=1 Tax=Paracoccus sp. SCSIO 75233 TaxID=3017782 RepID=UPI0022F143B3|nr:acyl-CoA dehydrogenase family protein [Paracoccus sp. SCSIO 75233]WBU52990.1 acyl-CoA/acyl-ACP dehydrogenase [Paracoccus sp. SCSIO 75233]